MDSVLIIGSGHNVERELATVDRSSFSAVIGVNRAAILYGPVDYHVTLHPEIYAKKKAAYMVAWKAGKGVDEVLPFRWPGCHHSGSSGLYAVKFALEVLVAENVTLAGIGMDGPHVYNDRDWPQAQQFQKDWIKVLPTLKGRVTSLGGWTKELLNG